MDQTLLLMDRQMEGRTDEAGYRVACTRAKKHVTDGPTEIRKENSRPEASNGQQFPCPAKLLFPICWISVFFVEAGQRPW